jgi:hypothetical protein
MSEPLSTAGENRTTSGAPTGEASTAQPAGMNGSSAHHAGSTSEPNRSADAASTANASEQATDAPPHVARAEEMVDRLADRVGQLTSVWGRRIARVAARVKEEAQDVWAEAQSIRRGDQP